ncbi:MAG: hypothetical protein VB024_11985 [Dysgonamonadaceae bacterium]|nr:hypothetical protein [Dysgonamonadaceae bacterium]MDD3309950.1 hypothetical protein [Dysgonamonadaceae bacterium]MDD3901560.1 hypothetical protein [Dysgonamonadaceae bacterium]MDD4399682.1 hypothetical protein [Dysgonamonadaceae bacterium]MEA5082321.1 hypothetical protein [Dysgonamonadaceae bacterium]
MSTKDFVKKQIDRFNSQLTEQQFLELTETENSLIILEVPFQDYSLTEIARLIESNSAHVLNLAVLPIAGGSTLLISIKLDVSDLSLVLRSFERNNLEVVYYFMREGDINDTQKDRLNELMYYLNM